MIIPSKRRRKNMLQGKPKNRPFLPLPLQSSYVQYKPSNIFSFCLVVYNVQKMIPKKTCLSEKNEKYLKRYILINLNKYLVEVILIQPRIFFIVNFSQ